MRRAATVLGVFIAVVGTFASHSPAHGACLLVDEPNVFYPRANTIFLARIVGPGSEPRLTELRVLDVYRGDVPGTIELRNGVLACFDLRDHIGRRVLLVQVDSPRYGPFTVGWFEVRGDWVNKGIGYDTLGELLARLGVGDLPDTATLSSERRHGSDITLPLVAGLAGTALFLAMRLRARMRPV